MSFLSQLLFKFRPICALSKSSRYFSLIIIFRIASVSQQVAFSTNIVESSGSPNAACAVPTLRAKSPTEYDKSLPSNCGRSSRDTTLLRKLVRVIQLRILSALCGGGVGRTQDDMPQSGRRPRPRPRPRPAASASMCRLPVSLEMLSHLVGDTTRITSCVGVALRSFLAY